ncbi:MAG: hypothetical protein KGJ78_16760 [Alphaproteobacteria bacterium]|nr:hypothetical protein [Alphaproteobacteria bacterium]
MQKPGAALVSTMLIGIAALCLCIAMLAISLSRGLNLADEGLYVYLLMHPTAPMPFMDTFVWGSMTKALNLNLVEVRWLTLVLLLSSSAALCVAVLGSLGGSVSAAQKRDLWGIAPVFTLLGALLYYTANRPTVSYSFTIILACNVFACAMFAAHGLRRHLRLPFELLAGAMVALAFTARPPSAVLLIAWQVLFGVIMDRSPGWAWRLLRSVPVTAASAFVVLGFAVLLGYDIKGQLTLASALVRTSHTFHDLARIDVPYGAAIILAAMAGAAAYLFWQKRNGAAAQKNSGMLVLIAVAIASLSAVVQLALAGALVPAPQQQNVFATNYALKSWGPAMHAAALCWLLVAAVPVFGKRLPVARNLISTIPDRPAVLAVQTALLLYLLCPLSQFGTNTGLWHRSIISMGPLFLAVALLIWDFGRRGLLRAWQMPSLVLMVSLPVAANIYANQIGDPCGLNGSIWKQTVELNRPAFLSGLLVSPQLIGARNELERELAAARFDRGHDVLLPGPSRIGLVDLTGSTALGNGWYFDYDDAQAWNCTVIAMGLRQPHRRIFVVDPTDLFEYSQPCISGFRLGKRTGKWVTELIPIREFVRAKRNTP